MLNNYDILKSINLQKHSKKRIPGMTQLLSKRPDQFSFGVWPGYYSKASGVEIWDLDENKYTDMSISGIGANILGYADKDVDDYVKLSISNGVSCSLNCPEEVELADLLCEIHPWADQVRFARTGGESMAIAVRIARAYTKKDKIAFCGYHGWHDWYLSANLNTENALGEHLLSGLNPLGVPKGLSGTSFPFYYNKLDELKTIVAKNKNDIAAIIMEPIRNIDPKPEFIEGVRAIADDIGAVLIIDEISAGFRMNTGGAHMILGIKPDIAVFSKALGNGYAIAAIIGKNKIMQSAQDTFISSTCWTERIGPTAAIATINKYRKYDVSKHLIEIGKQVQLLWKEIAKKYSLDITVGGIPPLSHFLFNYNNSLSIKALFVQLMLEKKFLASNIFYAMYAHKQEHIDKYKLAVDDVFCQLKNFITTNQVEKELKGQPAISGFKRLT